MIQCDKENDFSQNPEKQLGRELTVEEKEQMKLGEESHDSM